MYLLSLCKVLKNFVRDFEKLKTKFNKKFRKDQTSIVELQLD